LNLGNQIGRLKQFAFDKIVLVRVEYKKAGAVFDGVDHVLVNSHGHRRATKASAQSTMYFYKIFAYVVRPMEYNRSFSRFVIKAFLLPV
jgi:hypothetical protein